MIDNMMNAAAAMWYVVLWVKSLVNCLMGKHSDVSVDTAVGTVSVCEWCRRGKFERRYGV